MLMIMIVIDTMDTFDLVRNTETARISFDCYRKHITTQYQKRYAAEKLEQLPWVPGYLKYSKFPLKYRTLH